MNQPSDFPLKTNLLSVHAVVSHMFAENCYLVHANSDSRCVIVDPGLDFDSILDLISAQRLTPVAILLTHGHADHIAGVEPLKRLYPQIPVVIGTLDAPKLLNAELNLSAQYGMGLTAPPADRLINEGETLDYAGLKFSVFETPGHSLGHVIFVVQESQPQLILGGDVLFREGVGRTDFPDGSTEALVQSIQQKIFSRPDDTVVLPGHGPLTTVGYEKKFNPFVGEQSKRRMVRFP
jgi:hydroxyacylglutathione hydrolase